MHRPDCLSLSYSAARLCCEDSKHMRSLHLLLHHTLGKKTKTTTSSTQMVTWVFLVFKLYVWKTTEKCKRQYTIKNHLKICCCYSLCSPTQKIPKYFPSFLVSIDSISHTTSFPKSSNSETLKNHRPQLNNHVGEYPDSALNHQF